MSYYGQVNLSSGFSLLKYYIQCIFNVYMILSYVSHGLNSYCLVYMKIMHNYGRVIA